LSTADISSRERTMPTEKGIGPMIAALLSENNR